MMLQLSKMNLFWLQCSSSLIWLAAVIYSTHSDSQPSEYLTFSYKKLFLILEGVKNNAPDNLHSHCFMIALRNTSEYLLSIQVC